MNILSPRPRRLLTPSSAKVCAPSLLDLPFSFDWCFFLSSAAKRHSLEVLLHLAGKASWFTPELYM